MNIIVFDFSQGLGGAETFNTRLVSYLVDIGDNVAVVGRKGSFIFELLDRKGVEIKKYIIPEMDDFFVSLREQSYLAAVGQQIIDDFFGEEIYVLASYFDVLHKAMHIFNGDKRVHILTGILHPEAWSLWEPDVGFNAARSFKSKRIDRLWHYKRDLLSKLDGAKAIWYPNDIFRKYNEHYFSLCLHHRALATVPVEPVVHNINYQITAPENVLRVLWLGRFDFFKNESIFKFIEGLNELLEINKNITIYFDLIGYGVEPYENEVKSYCEQVRDRLRIRFIGKMNEVEIYSRVNSEKYHFAVAMGSSAYHLAMMGLPVLAIDSSVKGLRRLVKGVWLDEATDEFDEGSSLYLMMIGEEPLQRRDIIDILMESFDDGFLQKKSVSCSEYVKRYHSIDVLLPKIRNFILQSEFTDKITYRFERNLPDDFYYHFGDYDALDIAIFGTGTGALKFYDKIEIERSSSGKDLRVECYFDNNESKHGETFLGKEVKGFSFDGASDVDVIFVASDYWPEINCQLTSLGVEPRKIIRVY
ncbi:TPA: glycosyltransferase [Aeromonas bestiarum]|uniref:glycosyltransferase n=1 Tax=Aeromonas sp. CA23 TaxID=2033032 RepID=UPI000BFBFFB7|nr:glycosyltransferase [Aeromonas sp. CA23]ATL98052.1 hypothetical protein CK910_05755 [Aeromonas sp. CA23]HEH9404664.1 glycosyltransferase [Aeromonas bestiarum]